MSRLSNSPYTPDLHGFIAYLEAEHPDQIVRISKQVDPKFGVSGILERLERDGRFPLVIFENVKGSSIPLVANMHAASLRAINALCAERGIYHLADEVYEYFTYGSARHVSSGAFPGAEAHTIAMYSLSKAYGFAGWRIGYMTYPEHLAAAMAKVQDTILVCPPVASQVAAIAALEIGRAYCEPHVRELASIRDIVFSELSALAPLASVPAADGAFYALLNVNTDRDPMTIAERLIREHKVAVIPGPAFGMTAGCYFRVAYGALQKETVAEGIGRLVTGLRAILT